MDLLFVASSRAFSLVHLMAALPESYRKQNKKPESLTSHTKSSLVFSKGHLQGVLHHTNQNTSELKPSFSYDTKQKEMMPVTSLPGSIFHLYPLTV